jgi:hypothetical protein
MDEIGQIEERLRELADSLPAFDGDELLPSQWTAVTEALLASLEGHRPVSSSYNYDGEPEDQCCEQCGESWPCDVVGGVVQRLGVVEVRRRTIPKRVIDSALTSIKIDLGRLHRAGATLSALTEDHKLVQIEALWPGVGVVGSVTWDGREWIVVDGPV